MRPFPLTLLLIGSTLAAIHPVQAAKCHAWADADCVQAGLPNLCLEFPSLVGAPGLRLLEQVRGYLDRGDIEVLLEEIDPSIDACNVGKHDFCALVQELNNCDGEWVELPAIEGPDSVGTVVKAVNKLCRRQSYDPDDLLAQH